jgi:hypothetical protein
MTSTNAAMLDSGLELHERDGACNGAQVITMTIDMLSSPGTVKWESSVHSTDFSESQLPSNWTVVYPVVYNSNNDPLYTLLTAVKIFPTSEATEAAAAATAAALLAANAADSVNTADSVNGSAIIAISMVLFLLSTCSCCFWLLLVAPTEIPVSHTQLLDDEQARVDGKQQIVVTHEPIMRVPFLRIVRQLQVGDMVEIEGTKTFNGKQKVTEVRKSGNGQRRHSFCFTPAEALDATESWCEGREDHGSDFSQAAIIVKRTGKWKYDKSRGKMAATVAPLLSTESSVHSQESIHTMVTIVPNNTSPET